MRFFSIVLLFGVLLLSPGFTLGALNAPTSVYPTQEDSPVWKGRIEFKWTSTGAQFYKYFLNLPIGESKSETISSTSRTVYSLKLGNYSWAVRSCNDSKGTDCGEWSETQTFKIVPAPPGTTGGLIPCGRQYDDTIATPNIDESKPCSLPHLVLLLKNVLDFVLWRLGLLIIAVLAVATGFFTYFSFGAPDIGIKIRALWRALFVGYLIALFAWLAVNIILNVLGFQVQFFGTWWQLPF